jgi:hypothetical protein
VSQKEDDHGEDRMRCSKEIQSVKTSQHLTNKKGWMKKVSVSKTSTTISLGCAKSRIVK